MKLRMTLAFVLALSGCVYLWAKSDVIGEMVMIDGKKLDNVEIKLPKGSANNVSIVADDKEMKIPSDSIASLLFWHKDNPGQKCMLVYMQEGEWNRKLKEIKGWKYKSWFVVETIGDHLIYLTEYLKIKPSSSKIKIDVMTKPNHFVKKGTDVAVEIPDDNFFRVGKWLREFLSDDSKIVERIGDKGYEDRRQAFRKGGNYYNPFLYEVIAIDYNPDH